MGEPKNFFFKYHTDPAREPVIVDYCRTAIGRKNGKVCRVRGDDLVVHCINALIDRNKFIADDVKIVDDVIVGCNSQVGSCAADIGRTAALASKLDWQTPGMSINRLCASALQACDSAWQEVATGKKNCVMAGGVELQNVYPILADSIVGGETIPPNKKILTNNSTMASAKKYGVDMFPDQPAIAQLANISGLIAAAELMGHVWKAPRETLDEISYNSHMKANKDEAWEGRGKEIVPMDVPKLNENGKPILDSAKNMIEGETESADRDESVRPTTTPEILAKLKPLVLRKKGLLTAGNSCPTSDAAGLALWMPRGLAEEMGIPIRATMVGCVAVGTDPVLMLTGPIGSTRAVMDMCESSLDDMDVIEMNEAFSTVVYASCTELGLDFNDPRLNPWGGAIALGHPTGMSGVRLMGTVVNQLETAQKSYGLATFCVGFGMGIAAIMKREGA
jgi:acetyl-CoA acetyltransferase family protein